MFCSVQLKFNSFHLFRGVHRKNPSSPGRGWGGVPHPVLEGGEYPRPGPGIGVPLHLGWGTPHHLDGVPPTWTWDRVPLPAPGMGYPPCLDLGWGALPSPQSAGWGTQSSHSNLQEKKPKNTQFFKKKKALFAKKKTHCTHYFITNYTAILLFISTFSHL